VNSALTKPVTFATPVETIPVIRADPESATTDAFSKSTRRGGAVQPAQLISNSNPQYPPAAKDAGISGAVELHFKIGPNGEVREISVVKGPRILAEAAVDAVRARRYKPARVDGVPTETDASATFDFKLN
jgi:protein TonB